MGLHKCPLEGLTRPEKKIHTQIPDLTYILRRKLVKLDLKPQQSLLSSTGAHIKEKVCTIYKQSFPAEISLALVLFV